VTPNPTPAVRTGGAPADPSSADPSSADPSSADPRPAPSAAARESRLTALLIVFALLGGAVLQIWVPPGPWTAVVAAGLASWVVVALAFLVPGRLRQTMAGFRFTATLLVALAVFAILGTLILQGKPPELYRARYGVVAPIILALRFDDIFHGLPFAGLMALFGAAIINSTSLRLPPRGRNLGFFIAHVGLMVSLAGAAASATLGIRGRIDLHAGGDVAREVVVTKGGVATGDLAKLPFELKLDKFDLVLYESEYRVGYYAKQLVNVDGQRVEDWRLKTSFDPDLEKHRLPGGDSFRLKAVYPDFVTVPNVVAVQQGGAPALRAAVAGQDQWLLAGEGVATPDARLAVVFGADTPAPPEGVQTAVLVSLSQRKVTIHRADGDATMPYQDGLALLGGAVKLGPLVAQAQRTMSYGTASQEWRNPAAVLETIEDGHAREELVFAHRPRGVILARGGALLFEKREQEAKAFLSHVTATKGDEVAKATVAVNDPMSFANWTLYQVNYNPKDPTYSGLEAVYDPGVRWVFLGFVLICIGVFHLFYIAPRLAGGVKRSASNGAA
jgi:hypothetical protein